MRIWEKIGVPFEESMPEGAVELREHHPVIAQVFPLFRFEDWDTDKLLPLRTSEWVVRIYFIERDPSAQRLPEEDDKDHNYMRVLLHLYDRCKTRDGAKQAAAKIAAAFKVMLPSILRMRKIGKPLELKPIPHRDGGHVSPLARTFVP